MFVISSFVLEYRTVYNNLGRLKDVIEKDGQKAVNETADEIVKKTKQIISSRNHVDTSRLINSIHAVYKGKGSHSYSCSRVGAKSGRIVRGPTSFTESVGRPGTLEAVIGTAVPYAKFIHHGTRHISGTPFLKMALEGSISDFKKNILSVIKSIKFI